MKTIPNILSIAGSDPSGGAGVQADLKVCTALGCYGMAVMTALTAQNTQGIQGVHPVPADFVEAQIRSVFDDIRVDAVKIGMLGSVDVVYAVVKILREYKPAFVVLDPVMVATSGDALANDDVIEVLKAELIPLVDVVTPNGPEAEALLGRSLDDAERDAQELRALGADVLLKGGHFEPEDGMLCDVLIAEGGVQRFDMSWVNAPALHGTGCSLSSALACYTALGFALEEAVPAAQDFILAAIKAHDALDVGCGARVLNYPVLPLPNKVASTDGTEPGEFEAIMMYLAPLSLDGLRNDGVAFSVPDGMDLVVSTDTLNQGVHFLGGIAPEDLAHKALRVNVSDLASMGAQPYAYQLSLSLPQGGMPEEWWRRFALGLGEVQEQFGCRLSGGDTTSNLGGGISVSVTVFGLVPEQRMLTRGGAQAGDLLCVSGAIGDAMLGVEHMREGSFEDAAYFVQRCLRPEPRVSLGQALCYCAHACVDVSDGLIADVEHMAKASGLRAVVELNKVPLSDAARAAGLEAQRAVTGGDDYELAFAIAPEDLMRVRALDVPVTVIGRFETGDGVQVLDGGGQEVEMSSGGWRHF